MTIDLYLVIQRRKLAWQGFRIAQMARKRPVLKRAAQQALILLKIEIPDDILNPKAIRVQINPDHIVSPTVTATRAPA